MVLVHKCCILFFVFFKVGIFSFGGGYAMLPMIYHEISVFGLMSQREFSDLVALSQMTPGPIGVNAAAYVGFRYAGIPGAVTASAGVTVPSFLLIALVIASLAKFKSHPAVNYIIGGIRPATAGMMAAAVVFIARGSILPEKISLYDFFHNPLQSIHPGSAAIFVIVLIGLKKWKTGAGIFSIHPILLTILAGILGILIL